MRVRREIETDQGDLVESKDENEAPHASSDQRLETKNKDKDKTKVSLKRERKIDR